jgi:hypothetical protein
MPYKKLNDYALSNKQNSPHCKCSHCGGKSYKIQSSCKHGNKMYRCTKCNRVSTSNKDCDYKERYEGITENSDKKVNYEGIIIPSITPSITPPYVVTNDECNALAKQLGQAEAIETTSSPHISGCSLYEDGHIYYNDNQKSNGKKGLRFIALEPSSKAKEDWLNVDWNKSTYEYLMPLNSPYPPSPFHPATESECRDLQRLLGEEELNIQGGNQYNWKKGCLFNYNRVYWNPCDGSPKASCGSQDQGMYVYTKGDVVVKSSSSVWVWIVIIILVLAAAIGGGVYYNKKMKKEHTEL